MSVDKKKVTIQKQIAGKKSYIVVYDFKSGNKLFEILPRDESGLPTRQRIDAHVQHLADAIKDLGPKGYIVLLPKRYMEPMEKRGHNFDREMLLEADAKADMPFNSIIEYVSEYSRTEAVAVVQEDGSLKLEQKPVEKKKGQKADKAREIIQQYKGKKTEKEIIELIAQATGLETQIARSYYKNNLEKV